MDYIGFHPVAEMFVLGKKIFLSQTLTSAEVKKLLAEEQPPLIFCFQRDRKSISLLGSKEGIGLTGEKAKPITYLKAGECYIEIKHMPGNAPEFTFTRHLICDDAG